MELIIFPIAFIYFLWLYKRDMRDAKLRAAAGPWEITADVTIERDDAGQIRTIYVRLP